MKITELRCSACDGILKVDEENPKIAVCEYCHTKYILEWDKPGAEGYGDVRLKKMTEKISYQPIDRRGYASAGEGKSSQAKGAGILAAAGLALLIFGGIGVFGLHQKDQAAKDGAEYGESLIPGQKEKRGEGLSGSEGEASEKTALTGIFADFAEEVFDRPAEDITEKELAQIQWMEFKTTIDYREIGYSFADPQEDPEAALTWIKFPRDSYGDISTSCLSAFTGLKRIWCGQSLRSEDLKGLSLTGIGGYFDSLEEVAAILEKPENLRYLNIIGSQISLEGLESLPGLETLILEADQIDESKKLINGKALKELSLDMYDGSIDFSVLGMMTGLERLSISSKGIRDLGFVEKMPELQSLHIEYGTLLTLAPLSGNTGLKELFVEGCDEIKDMSAVSGLTGLEKLKIELPYNCPQPDLNSLVNMKELYLEDFDETGFLRNMTGLENLTLDSCNVSSATDLEGLTSLKSLICTAFSPSERDYSFIPHLPALEELSLRGAITYKDISGIFNMPTLKRLDIGHMQCEINFDKINENTTLEALSVDGMKLYKNVSVSGGGGIVYVDWDDVNFTEHLDFFQKLKGLKELTIRENELTEIEFASSLGALESIDFSDNYVTDLSPLSGLKNLSQVVCEENPISDYEVLGGSVIVLR